MDQIRPNVCYYLHGSARGRFHRYTYKKPWRKYIDDIFIIWQHREDQLNIFSEKLDNLHPSIKFTCEYSRDRVDYLDVLVIVLEGKLITDLYVNKSTAIKTQTIHHVIDTTALNQYLMVKHQG